jgi:hypothetical protein
MRKLKAEDVEIVIETEEEPDHWTDRIFDYAPEAQAAFAEMVEKHGLWGWCQVTVSARWRGYKGKAYLGCCSYENEAAFMADDYYKQMLEDALADLNADVAQAFANVDEARSELRLSSEEAAKRKKNHGTLSWPSPQACPHCQADLRDRENGVPYSRIISIYSREEDRTTHWKCPDCCRQIIRGSR